jgi:hypothetical protein
LHVWGMNYFLPFRGCACLSETSPTPAWTWTMATSVVVRCTQRKTLLVSVNSLIFYWRAPSEGCSIWRLFIYFQSTCFQWKVLQMERFFIYLLFLNGVQIASLAFFLAYSPGLCGVCKAEIVQRLTTLYYFKVSVLGSVMLNCCKRCRCLRESLYWMCYNGFG